MARTPLYLNGIRAFEATARGGSFAAAAEELNIAPSAVSRMVALLEDRVGVPLFQRRANKLAITRAGQTYQAGLTPLLDGMAALTAEVSQLTPDHVVTIGVGPTFAMRWLIPRLAAFKAEAPEIDVRIVTGGAAAPYQRNWTCGVVLGDAPEGLTAEPLFNAQLTPVAAPAIAARLKSPADLKAAELIQVAHAPDDWRRWFGAADLDGPVPAGPTLEFYGQALQAAVDGLGVAMGLSPYIDDDVAAGRLVRPFPQTVPHQRGWRLVYDPRRLQEPDFLAFRAWLDQAAHPSTAAG